MIPYGRQNITDEDIDAVTKVLRSDFLTQGPSTPAFEQGVSNLVGAKYAVAVNSATSALHLACLALGVGKGDVVWTSPISFVASANCALYCGAKVDFVDINPDTANMCCEKLYEKLLNAKKTGSLPKVIIPVHFSGESCDMKRIKELSDLFGFKILEDASHAIGGKYKDNWIGDCRFSDAVVFSFHPVKIITSGEGGMVVTNDKNVAQKTALLRSHGVTRDPEAMLSTSDGDWYYQQIDLGFNYRMTDLQSALGNNQLLRISANTERRQQISKVYDGALEGGPYKSLQRDVQSISGMHLYVVQIFEERSGLERKKVFDFLRSQGVGVNVHYIPIHLQPYYKKLGFMQGQFPSAEAYYRRAFSIPIYPSLSDESIKYVIDKMFEAAQ